MKPLLHPFKRLWFSLIGIFSPSSGLVPAALELNRAIAEARRKNARDGHLYYVIWNSMGRRLVTLTYDIYRGRTDSYVYMRHRGAFPPVTREKFKESAFFYTGSKNGAKEMTEDEVKVKLQVLRQRYYQQNRKGENK